MWDSFQREMLAALGHVVYRPAGVDVDVANAGVEAADATPTRDEALPPAASPAPPLLRALARAAGIAPTQLPALPPLPQLRDAAAKRALWPQLRALRRSLQR